MWQIFRISQRLQEVLDDCLEPASPSTPHWERSPPGFLPPDCHFLVLFPVEGSLPGDERHDGRWPEHGGESWGICISLSGIVENPVSGFSPLSSPLSLSSPLPHQRWGSTQFLQDGPLITLAGPEFWKLQICPFCYTSGERCRDSEVCWTGWEAVSCKSTFRLPV